MSHPSQGPWSDSPNSPMIPNALYTGEKGSFAGNLIGAMLYGIIIVLFFQCMSALFDPVNRTTGGTRWGLVSYTVAMFSFVTVYTAINLDILSVSYIDNREFPAGVDGVLPPGPFGYQALIYSRVMDTISNVMFLLNNWLADGLLLYRCCVIYAMNYWVIAFPCLMYLASLVMGTMLTYKTSQPDSNIRNPASIFKFGVPYFSISVSLNILLTLIIVIRLILHTRNIQSAIGATAGGSRSYKAIVTMLVESCALYAVSSVLYIGPWSVRSFVSDIFFPILVETQVIAPFLIILRVANRRALTSNVIVSGNVGSIHFESQGKSTDGTGTRVDEDPAGSMGTNGETPGGHGVGIREATVDEVPL